MCPSGRFSSTTTGFDSDFRSAFDVLDADRDGKISRDDLKTFYNTTTTTTTPTSDEDIGSMISVADSNKDGFVEFDEFKQVLNCSKDTSCASMAIMEDVFKVMDKDGDGKVGFEDLKTYMKLAGFSSTDQEIKSMIQVGGGENSGGVCFEGLLKILAIDVAGVYN